MGIGAEVGPQQTGAFDVTGLIDVSQVFLLVCRKAAGDRSPMLCEGLDDVNQVQVRAAEFKQGRSLVTDSAAGYWIRLLPDLLLYQSLSVDAGSGRFHIEENMIGNRASSLM